MAISYQERVEGVAYYRVSRIVEMHKEDSRQQEVTRRTSSGGPRRR